MTISRRLSLHTALSAISALVIGPAPEASAGAAAQVVSEPPAVRELRDLLEQAGSG